MASDRRAGRKERSGEVRRDQRECRTSLHSRWGRSCAYVGGVQQRAAAGLLDRPVHVEVAQLVTDWREGLDTDGADWVVVGTRAIEEPDWLAEIADQLDDNLLLASRNLANVLVVEPRYADPLSLVHYKKVLVTKGAIEQLKEMLG